MLFYPNANGQFQKKNHFKSERFPFGDDSRKFLAKKDFGFREYRIESGLNCGGHAFATDGFY